MNQEVKVKNKFINKIGCNNATLCKKNTQIMCMQGMIAESELQFNQLLETQRS